MIFVIETDTRVLAVNDDFSSLAMIRAQIGAVENHQGQHA